MQLFEILKAKTKGIISIDFTEAFLKIAYLRSSGQSFELLNYDTKEILSAEEKISQSISFINDFLKTNSILSKEAYISIAEPENIIIKHLILPVLPKEDIPGAIKWQLKGEAAFDLENAILDWQVVKEFNDEEGAKKIEIMYALARQEAVKRYLSVLAGCNLTAVKVSCSYFNYANILNSLPSQPPTIAVLDIGDKNAAISVYRNSKLNFLRSLVLSTDKFVQSLTGTLMSDKGKSEISFEKAKEIIRDFGIPKDEGQVLKDNILAIHVISLIRPILEGLVLELKRSFDYFSATLKEEVPTLLYITGAGANLKNLDWYLNKELKIDVKELPLPQCFRVEKISKEMLERSRNQIMSLLGAPMTGSGDINLLPQEMKTQKIEFLERISLRLIGVTLAAILLFLLFILKFQERDYTKRLNTAKLHLQTIDEIRVLKGKINDRIKLIDKVKKNKIPVYGVLKQISNIMPASMILNELSLDLGQNSLILRGVVLSRGETAEDILTEFMKNAEATLFFKEATLLESKITAGVQEFIIKCDLSN